MPAFLDPHFSPDVFVSYSHGDPRGAGDSMLKTWTHALIRKLEGQILALDDEFDDLNIWMDAQIDPTAHLSEELRRKVGTSGVLLIVMSKRYLRSAWCRDELDWFRGQIQDRAGDVGRVFVLKIQPTEAEAWPDFLRDERGHAMPGFTFYSPGEIMPWGWPDLHDMDREFVKELCRLHTALTKRLRELRQRAAKRAAEAAAAAAAAEVPALPPPSGPRRIFLHAPSECEPERIDIGRILSQDGILSLTTKADPGGGLAAWQRDATLRMETAKRCEALALLRTEEAGDRFVGDLFGIGVDERERIETARGAPLPCAVLDKTGGELPIDPMFGIQHFDVNRASWRGEFRAWLDAARRNDAAAQV